jgi:predicted XRE-type DNA-binding protein
MKKPHDEARHAPQDISIEGSSGNVFADLGFDNADDEILKAQLTHVIAALLEERGATQSKAAALLGTTQPKVSNLLRGRTELFSVQKLFDFLNRLDQDVVVSLRPKQATADRGRTTLHPGTDNELLAAAAMGLRDAGIPMRRVRNAAKLTAKRTWAAKSTAKKAVRRRTL